MMNFTNWRHAELTLRHKLFGTARTRGCLWRLLRQYPHNLARQPPGQPDKMAFASASRFPMIVAGSRDQSCIPVTHSFGACSSGESGHRLSSKCKYLSNTASHQHATSESSSQVGLWCVCVERTPAPRYHPEETPGASTTGRRRPLQGRPACHPSSHPLLPTG
jgi:hypothetical protein